MSSSKRRLQSKLKTYQRNRQDTRAMIGNRMGQVTVPNRTDYIYCWLSNNEVIEVFNNRVNPTYGLKVNIGYDPKEPHLLQVLSIRNGSGSGLNGSSGSSGSVPHARAHEWLAKDGGNDVVFSQLRQFMPLRPSPSGGMNLHVYRGATYLNGEWRGISGSTIDFTPYVPITGSLYHLVYVNQSGNLGISSGTLKDAYSLTGGDIPTPLFGTLPIAAIRLYGGQTGIAEARTMTDIVDLRFPMAHSSAAHFDMPQSLVGSGGYVLTVKQDLSGYELSPAGSGGGSGGSVSVTGSFVSPLTTQGDMIYSTASGTVVGANQAVHELGADATASSYSNIYIYPPEYVLRSHVAYDQWENVGWASEGAWEGITGAWVYVDLGSEKTIAAWSLKQGSNIDQQAASYIISKSNDASSWTPIITHAAADGQFDSAVFSVPQSARYFKFQPTMPRMGPDHNLAHNWYVVNVGLYASAAGQAPTRLPIGTEGQTLRVVNDGGLLRPGWSSTSSVTWDNLSGKPSIFPAALPVYDDGTFKATGTAVVFGNDLDVGVTGSIVYVDYGGATVLGSGIAVSTTKETLLTRTVLYDVTTTGTSQFDITDIAQTYDHLELLIIDGRTSQNASHTPINLSLNNDTTNANYRVTSQYTSGASAAVGAADARTVGNITAATAAANSIGNIRVEIPVYRSSNKKAYWSKAVWRAAATTLYTYFINGEWENTAAITRITIDPGEVCSFVSGTRVQLIGIKETEIVTDVSGGGLVYSVNTSLSSPPSESELTSEFGSPATVGAGWSRVVKNTTNMYLISSDGTYWYYQQLTKAT